MPRPPAPAVTCCCSTTACPTPTPSTSSRIFRHSVRRRRSSSLPAPATRNWWFVWCALARGTACPKPASTWSACPTSSGTRWPSTAAGPIPAPAARFPQRRILYRLKPLHPEMKVLYTSGYTDATVVHLGLLDESLPPETVHARRAQSQGARSAGYAAAAAFLISW
jgi:hypothetical protein